MSHPTHPALSPAIRSFANKTGPAPRSLRVEDLTSLQDLWDAHREIYSTKGVDIAQVLAAWSELEIGKLSTVGRESFEALCEDRCHPFVLAAIVALFRYRSDLEAFSTLALGSEKKREKVRRTLDKAADSIELVFAGLDQKDEQVRQLGRIPPRTIVQELQFYGRMLNVAGSLAKEAKVRSLEQFSLYLLSSYVDGATDRPHDGHVARLIAEINGKPGYTVHAHQRWRGRNLQKMHANISSLFSVAELLIALGRVIPRPT